MADGSNVKTAREKLASHLECSICMDRYKEPKVLECQHSFCGTCLEVYYKNGNGKRRTRRICCPDCRQTTKIPKTGIQDLKLNRQLRNIVEEFSVQETSFLSSSSAVAFTKHEELPDVCPDGEYQDGLKNGKQSVEANTGKTGQKQRRPSEISLPSQLMKFNEDPGPGGRAVRMLQLCEEFGKGEFKGARDIVEISDEIISVADFWNLRITFHSTKHCALKIAPMLTITNPRCISFYGQKLIYVGYNSCVRVVTTDGLTLDPSGCLSFTVPRSDFDATNVNIESVAVKEDGTILLGDVEKKVLTAHQLTNGALLRTLHMETEPHFLAVDNLRKRLVVSGYNAARVDITDYNGAIRHIIRPTIEGRAVKFCNGVCCDDTGIYVAVVSSEYGTGHIHHYDITGGFLGCLAQGLTFPLGITMICDDRIAVADNYSVKIYRKVLGHR